MRPGLEKRFLLSLGEYHKAHVARRYGPEFAGVMVRTTRLFLAGDVVFVHFLNGMGERAPVTGWSSKRRAGVWRTFVQYARWSYDPLDPDGPMRRYDDRVPCKLVARPEQLASDRMWSEPGVRQLVLSALRAAYPALAVSTDNGR